MDILLSWSRTASHETAKFLKEWLTEVLPGCKPWVSSEDIAKGKPWWDELHSFLGSAKVAVIIVTPENVQSPWLYYEAGVIAAKLSDGASVCPYLVGVAGKLILGTPLAPYQWTESDKSDTLKLIQCLNRALATPHDPGLVEGSFNARWPQLKRRLEKITEYLADIEDPVERTEPPLSQQLSADAVVLLQSACKDEGSGKGCILAVKTLEGLCIQAGAYTPGAPGNPREDARWKSAVDELSRFGLIETSGRGEVFTVTHRGWQVYDELGPPPAGDPFVTSEP